MTLDLFVKAAITLRGRARRVQMEDTSADSEHFDQERSRSEERRLRQIRDVSQTREERLKTYVTPRELHLGEAPAAGVRCSPGER